MLKTFRTFFAIDQSGAITVDWVVLTAAVAGLGILALLLVGGDTTDLASSVSTNMNATETGTTATP